MSCTKGYAALGTPQRKRQLAREMSDPKEVAKRAPTLKQATQRFSGETIDDTKCQSRVWNSGHGGQCSRTPVEGGRFCVSHKKDDKWKVHGEITGPVPRAKLEAFEKFQAMTTGSDGAASSKSTAAAAARAAARASTSAPASVSASASAAAAAAGPTELVSDDEREADSDSDCGAFDGSGDASGGGAELLGLPPPRLGSGVIEGAEAVAAHVRARPAAAAEVEVCVAPGTPTKKRKLARDESDVKDVAKKTARRDAAPPTAAKLALPPPSTKEQLPSQQQQQQAELGALFEPYGIPSCGRSRLQPLLERWGAARTSQIAGLWTFLGDGATKPISVPNLHLWGAQGTGKTALLVDYLDTLGIRSLWVNCAWFTGIGELQAHIVELLRRWAQEVTSAAAGGAAVRLPKEMQHRLPPGKKIRALDRLEFAMGKLIDHVLQKQSAGADCGAGGGGGGAAGAADVKVLLVLDQAQELGRLGAGAADLLTSLPEILRRGSQLAVATVARVPLSSLNLGRAQDGAKEDPPSVAFSNYTLKEAEAVLMRELRKVDGAPAVLKQHLQTIVSVGVLTFAAPHVGRGMDTLLGIGEELLRDVGGALRTTADSGGRDFSLALQRCVEQALESRSGLCGLGGFLKMAGGEAEEMDPVYAAATAAAQRMTEAEKRLILSAYLASRIPVANDLQLFAPTFRRNARRPARLQKRREDEKQPPQTRPPRPSPLARVLAMYHHFAEGTVRRTDAPARNVETPLLGAPLFEHFTRLCEVGLLQLDRACLEHDARVHCRAELGLVKRCAKDLKVDLPEYLSED